MSASNVGTGQVVGAVWPRTIALFTNRTMNDGSYVTGNRAATKRTAKTSHSPPPIATILSSPIRNVTSLWGKLPKTDRKCEQKGPSHVTASKREPLATSVRLFCKQERTIAYIAIY